MSSVQQIKRVYYAITFLFWLGVALPLPIFVLYIQSRGVDLFQIGIIMGFYSLAIVLLELPTGGLADAVGRKKVALLAYSIMLISGIMLFLAFSFPAFLLAMVLYGAGRALASGALDAWFVDSLQTADPTIELQPALAKVGTVTLLALGIGTLGGGLLPMAFTALPTDEAALLTPLSITLLFSALVQALLLVVIAVGVHEQRPLTAQNSGWRNGITNVPAIMHEALQTTKQNRSLMLLLSTTLVGGLALAGIETFWQPRFAIILGSGAENSWAFGLIMAGSFLMGIVGNMVSIPLSKRLNKRYAIVAALARGLQGILLIALALQAGIMPAVFLFWMVYLSSGLLGSPHETLVNEEIPAERRSTMLSVQSLASYVGGFIGSVVLGYLAQNISISAAWIVAGVLSMVSLFLYVGVDRRRQQQQETYEQKEPLLDRS